jgi:hypothetical protein
VADDSYTLVNPVSINKLDAAGRTLEAIQAVRNSTAGPLTAADVFPQSSYCRWTVNSYAQNRLQWSRVYHAIPAEGPGVPGENYDQSGYGYDFAGRQNRVQSPGGTIYRALFDNFDHVAAIYVGTDDTGASDAEPTGNGASGNNMALVIEYEYDAGCSRGDDNLTRVTQWVDGATSRVTRFGYDWRDRRVVVEGEEGLFLKLYYDNLDNLIRTEQYDGRGTENLVSLSETGYDALGRVYRQTTYGVDPATGAIGNVLATNTWYDLSGIRYAHRGSKRDILGGAGPARRRTGEGYARAGHPHRLVNRRRAAREGRIAEIGDADLVIAHAQIRRPASGLAAAIEQVRAQVLAGIRVQKIN